MTVHATYRVEAVEGGARYTIDSCATRDIALPAPGATWPRWSGL